MPRSLGKLQVRLLAILESRHEPLDTFELTALAFEVRPRARGRGLERTQVNSTHRALQRLAEAKLIMELGRNFRGGRTQWASLQVGLPLAIRRAQTLNEFDAAEGRHAAVLHRLGEMRPLIHRAQALGIEVAESRMSPARAETPEIAPLPRSHRETEGPTPQGVGG